MSGPDPAADLAAVTTATDRLVRTAEELDADDLGAASLLPGWTRGHVLTHLSRNADALVNVLVGRPMYASETARDDDIETGAGRPPEAQLNDLRESAERLREAAARFSGSDWERTVELRNGVTDTAGSVPFRRWVEVELHHVDLGTGRTVGDLPGAFTDRALDYLTARFRGAAAVPPLEVRAEDGRSWHTGRAPDDTGSVPGGPGTATGRLVVTGPSTALVGWLTGRTSGSGLNTSGAELPPVPPL